MVSRSAILLDLDSISQREIAKQATAFDVDGSHPLAGALRAAVLYGDRLVITDSQVFDGPLLLELGPGGLGDLLGYVHRSTAVSISLRAQTAAGSLSQLHSSAIFEWQVEAMEWPRELIDQRQAAWVRAIDGDKIAHSTRPPQPQFANQLRARLERTLSAEPTTLAQLLLRTADAMPVVSRSEMRDIVNKSAATESEREIVRDWWDAAYMDTIAAQHGAFWISSTKPKGRTGPKASAPPSRSDQLRITDEISSLAVERLADLSGSEFAALRAVIRPIQNRQREKPTFYDRLRLRIAVLDGTKRAHPLWEFIQSLGRVAAWIGVLVLALVDTSGLGKWVLVTGTIVGIAVQAPVLELDVLWRSFSKETRAFIRDPIGGRE